MSETLDVLVHLLDDLRRSIEVSQGTQPEEERQRVFGGQVAAQYLMAAGRTVDHGRPHSLHAYFLRPGDPEVPILYEVDRIRDGRSFTTRRVVAIQHGPGHLQPGRLVPRRARPAWRTSSPMPEVPDPESLPVAPRAAGPLA